MIDKEKLVQDLENPEFHKQISLVNFSYFNKYYLELDTPKHQRKWSGLLQKKLNLNNKKRPAHLLLLAPRDHGKSIVCTYAFPIWNICRDRNIRILIISKTIGQARKFLGQIQQELLRNKELKATFGDFQGPSHWTQTYMYIPRDSREKDPTIEVCGVLGAITGGHFDLIIADDILDENSVKTKDMMDNIRNWFFGTIRHLAEPWTKFLVVGTRKHYLDLYNELLHNPVWYNHVDKAIIKFPDNYEYVENDEGKIIDVVMEGDYKVLWPEKWTIQHLLIERHETGTILFDREKQNDPSGMRGQMLKLEWLHFYTTDVNREDLPHIPMEFKYKFIGVDLAISEDPDADYFALAVVGVCKNNYWWVIDIYRNKLEFPEQVSVIERYSQMHNPIRVYIESNAYQSAMVQHMQRFTAAPVLPRKTTRDKVTRMIAVSPFFESGRVRVRDNMNDFVTEWLHFPKGEHDDMLDAVEIALNDIRNPAFTGSSVTGVKMKSPQIINRETGELHVQEAIKHFKRQGSKGQIFKIG